MSHEYTLFPTEEEEFSLIQLEPTRPEALQSYEFFYIPDEPSYLRQEFSGLQFEGIQYTWAEFDYRLGVEYNAIPETSCTSLLMAVVVGIMVVRKLINK